MTEEYNSVVALPEAKANLRQNRLNLHPIIEISMLVLCYHNFVSIFDQTDAALPTLFTVVTCMSSEQHAHCMPHHN